MQKRILINKKCIKKLSKMIASPNTDLWAIDEVHLQQHGSRWRMWIAPEESDLVLKHEPTCRKVGYFGAVWLRDGKFVYSREDDKFNGETFWKFLKKLRKASCQSCKKVIVISDNARHHHAKLYKNTVGTVPIEMAWKVTRRCCIHNIYFPTLGGIVNAVEIKFDEWAQGSNILKKSCAIKSLCIVQCCT